jgi:hypothetical protein
MTCLAILLLIAVSLECAVALAEFLATRHELRDWAHTHTAD